MNIEEVDDISNLDESDIYYNELSDENSESDTEIIEDNQSILAIHNTSKHDIVNTKASYHKMMNETKTTRPYMSKFEFTKLYGLRTQQILNGSNPLVKVPHHITDAKDIVKLELKQQKVPIIVRRYTSMHTYEDWRISEFLNLHVYLNDI
jgi:DNA-directed RNA polymerase subunit K/omega